MEKSFSSGQLIKTKVDSGRNQTNYCSAVGKFELFVVILEIGNYGVPPGAEHASLLLTNKGQLYAYHSDVEIIR